jgi:hypothetical protein
MVIGRDHAEVKKLHAEDRRDQFAPHFAKYKKPLRPGCPPNAGSMDCRTCFPNGGMASTAPGAASVPAE